MYKALRGFMKPLYRDPLQRLYRRALIKFLGTLHIKWGLHKASRSFEPTEVMSYTHTYIHTLTLWSFSLQMWRFSTKPLYRWGFTKSLGVYQGGFSHTEGVLQSPWWLSLGFSKGFQKAYRGCSMGLHEAFSASLKAFLWSFIKPLWALLWALQ